LMLQVQGGWLDGSAIRKARKPFKCEYWRGASNGGRCRKPIQPGDFYVVGEGNGETGPNGVLLQDKYCVACAGTEAVATVARIGL
jgi:hypothetical protein